MPISQYIARAVFVGLFSSASAPAFSQAPSPQVQDQKSLAELRARFSAEAETTELSKALLAQAAASNPKSFEWLVQRGADCDFQTASGVNAVMIAASKLPFPPDLKEEERMAKELPGARSVPRTWEDLRAKAAELTLEVALSCTKRLNAKDAAGFAAIHRAAARQRFDAAIRLVAMGADINLPDGNGDTAVMAADLNALPLLVKQGANINAADVRGQTVLHKAFRDLAGPTLLRFVSVAVELGAKDSQDKSGKFASQMDGNLHLDFRSGAQESYWVTAHLDQARKLVRATRP